MYKTSVKQVKQFFEEEVEEIWAINPTCCSVEKIEICQHVGGGMFGFNETAYLEAFGCFHPGFGAFLDVRLHPRWAALVSPVLLALVAQVYGQCLMLLHSGCLGALHCSQTLAGNFVLECTGSGAGPVQHPVQHDLKSVGKSHLDLIPEGSSYPFRDSCQCQALERSFSPWSRAGLKERDAARYEMQIGFNQPQRFVCPSACPPQLSRVEWSQAVLSRVGVSVWFAVAHSCVQFTVMHLPWKKQGLKSILPIQSTFTLSAWALQLFISSFPGAGLANLRMQCSCRYCWWPTNGIRSPRLSDAALEGDRILQTAEIAFSQKAFASGFQPKHWSLAHDLFPSFGSLQKISCFFNILITTMVK